MRLKIFLALFLGLWCAAWARQEEEPKPLPHVEASTILQRVLAHRGLGDFSLKARLFVSRDNVIPVEMLVHNTPEETRTIYKTGKTELLVIQPLNAGPRWFLKGAGELQGAQLQEKFGGSQFTFYDLGLPFLHWPSPKLVGEERVRGQDCFAVELSATNQPYARVKLAVDEQYYALLRVEIFDENEGLIRRLSITSFKRLGELWIPKGIDMAYVLPRQALPGEEKSRLDIYEGNYEAKLPADMFSEQKFSAKP